MDTRAATHWLGHWGTRDSDTDSGSGSESGVRLRAGAAARARSSRVPPSQLTPGVHTPRVDATMLMARLPSALPDQNSIESESDPPPPPPHCTTGGLHRARTPTMSDSQRANEGSSEEGASIVPPRILSPAQALDTDAVLSVFRFLSLKELPLVMRTCKAWRAARQEKSRGVRVAPPLRRLPSLLTSPLRHHIAAFSLPGYFDTCTLDQLSALSTLPALTSCKVALRAMDPRWITHFHPDGTEVEEVAVNWPARLRTACITLDGEPTGLLTENALAHAQRALVSLISRRFSALTNLTLHLRARAPTLNLQPLQAMPSLTSLTLEGIKLTPLQLHPLKQMRSLRYLSSVNEWINFHLVALCHPPHVLTHLQELDLSQTRLTGELASSLVGLPALTSLEPSQFNPTTLPWLVHFPHLAHLHWYPDQAMSGILASVLWKHLRGCNALRELHITRVIFEQSDIAELAAASPLLESLELFRCTLSSMAGLRDLRHLANFHIDLHANDAFIDAFLAELLQTASLRTLSIQLPERDLLNGVRNRIMQATQQMQHLTSVTIK